MKNMKYKAGNRVKIKSLDWYNKNKDKHGIVCLMLSSNSRYNFIESMTTLCGKVVTIEYVYEHRNCYDILEDVNKYHWTDEMIEGLAEEKSITTNELQLNQSNTSLEKEMEWNLPQGYQFKDENGNVIKATKIVLEKIKKEYPKTYKECLAILNYNMGRVSGYKASLLASLQDLLVCRNAYWKIAGEEMGLEKPWEPDWTNFDQLKYCIWVDVGDIILNEGCRCQHILTFPTKEMRDDFSENFKKEIEQCKELL